MGEVQRARIDKVRCTPLVEPSTSPHGQTSIFARDPFGSLICRPIARRPTLTRRWKTSGRWSGNPATYPEWWPAAVETRGERFEVGDIYTQVVGIAGRRPVYSRVIDRRDELKELRYGLFDKTVGRWFLKRWAEQAIDGLRRTLSSDAKA